jgi:hypothetical protein
MTLKELKKDIAGVFKPPVKKYYFGKLLHGAPYFFPINFNKNIISFRKIIKKTEEELNELQFHHMRKSEYYQYKNLPMVRRSKDWIFKLFGNYYWLEIGFPISIYYHGLGWKDKFESPRHEWNPAFYIFFFRWQFCIWWVAPPLEKPIKGYRDNDTYYEMILWYSRYCDKDIEKARSTWSWVDGVTKKSTWIDEYLIKHWK